MAEVAITGGRHQKTAVVVGRVAPAGADSQPAGSRSPLVGYGSPSRRPGEEGAAGRALSQPRVYGLVPTNGRPRVFADPMPKPARSLTIPACRVLAHHGMAAERFPLRKIGVFYIFRRLSGSDRAGGDVDG